MKRQIAFLALTPLGDSILTMAELVELHRIYDPCEITVFAIPLIAELFANFKYCDHVVVLDGGIHGNVTLAKVPETVYDAVFNHGYEPWWTDIVKQLHCRKAYGMEELYRPAKECAEVFDRWVPLDYWQSVTLKKYPYASQQMAELIRLVSPEFTGDIVHLSQDNYQVVGPEGMPPKPYVLFMPGTSAEFKHYPIQKFFSLAKVVHQMGLDAVFAVGPQDDPLCEELRGKEYPVFSSLPLNELAGLICGASLVVGVDSGPMHFSAAFDRPTVHLFSFSGADTWFPHSLNLHKILMPDCGKRDGLDCRGCTRTCIGKIRLRDVAETMAALLGKKLPHFCQIACFAQDRTDDVLMGMERLEMLSSHYAPCEITVFCTKKETKRLLDGYAFADRVVVRDPTTPCSRGKADVLESFDAVFDMRLGADSSGRQKMPGLGQACGSGNTGFPEEENKAHCDMCLPPSRAEDFHLPHETSMTARRGESSQPATPCCEHGVMRLDESTYVHDYSDATVLPANRVVFVLGESDRIQHWGVDKYMWLAQRLQTRGYVVAFIAESEENDYADEIENKGFRVFKNLDFATIAAVVSRSHGAQCVVGNNTALMHFACLLGSPSVTIIPWGAQAIWFSYGEDQRAPHLLCVPDCARAMCPQGCPNKSNCVESIGKECVEEKVNLVLSWCRSGQRSYQRSKCFPRTWQQGNDERVFNRWGWATTLMAAEKASEERNDGGKKP